MNAARWAPEPGLHGRPLQVAPGRVVMNCASEPSSTTKSATTRLRSATYQKAREGRPSWVLRGIIRAHSSAAVEARIRIPVRHRRCVRRHSRGNGPLILHNQEPAKALAREKCAAGKSPCAQLAMKCSAAEV